MSRKFSANGFVALGPVAAEPLKTVGVQGRKDFVVGEYPAFVDLARDAPVGRKAHEHRVADGEPGFAADPALENSHFYNTVLKNYVTPWTNEDQTHNSSLISM